MPEHGPACWWQFLCEHCYILPAMCTCATLVSYTSGKSICPPWQSEWTDGARGSSPWSVSLPLCRSWVTVAASGQAPGIMHMYPTSSRWLLCVLTADHVGTPLMSAAEMLSHLLCEIAVYVTLTRQPLDGEALLHCLNWLGINWVIKNTSTQTRSQKAWWKKKCVVFISSHF